MARRGRLAWARRDVWLPRRPVPAVNEAERARAVAAEALDAAEATGASHADLRRARTRLEGTELQLARARSQDEPRGSRPVTLLGVRVDDLILVMVPGEVFASTLTGTALGGRDDVLVVGLANGDAGYFPLREAFAPPEPGETDTAGADSFEA